MFATEVGLVISTSTAMALPPAATISFATASAPSSVEIRHDHGSAGVCQSPAHTLGQCCCPVRPRLSPQPLCRRYETDRQRTSLGLSCELEEMAWPRCVLARRTDRSRALLRAVARPSAAAWRREQMRVGWEAVHKPRQPKLRPLLALMIVFQRIFGPGREPCPP